MAKKGDEFYFENFIACAGCACRAAQMLEEVLVNFDAASLPKKLEALHEIEHEGDEKKHEMLDTLLHAFITPIEREDIISLNQNIDEVTDSLEDVLLRVYISNVTKIRPEAIEFTKIIIRCCDTLQKIMNEFSNFKKSKALHPLIIEVNALEEEGDRLFISSMRKLHTDCKDPLEIIAWRDIFIYLEKCADACEHVADVVEGVVMKNS